VHVKRRGEVKGQGGSGSSAVAARSANDRRTPIHQGRYLSRRAISVKAWRVVACSGMVL
jgi:hypothetical protein